MLYEVYLQNGPTIWLAFETKNEEEALSFFGSTRAQYIYLRILDEKGNVVSMRCEKR